jgi:GNAT superfamily N-acetyltransferase
VHRRGLADLRRDRARAQRAFTGPGVTSVVAVDDGTVVGFATLLSDGAIQAYLALLVVRADRRRRGVGRALLAAAHEAGGALRVDLLAEPDARAFYATLPHRQRPGFRVYPGGGG